MSLKKIRVYGKLRKFLGQTFFEANVDSPSQALKFLLCNFPDVESHMANQFYKIKMGNQDIPLDLIHLKGVDEIKIIPVASGSTIPILPVGKKLSTGSTFISSAIDAIPMLGGVTSAVARSVSEEGVTSLLTPTQSVSSADNPFTQNDPMVQASNYGFNGIQNVSRGGVPVPIIYGERFVGSIIVSNGVDTVQVEGTA
jgi:predicted phage tail protein|tara:strand:+ start:604 stop:1197 length:594 start_codon:yes stop_codon:yes gene_type:complete